VKEIKTLDEYIEVIAVEKPTVVKFYADWCKDCRFIDPFMPEVEEKYKDQLTLISLDRDQFIDLAQELNVLGIPSFIAYKNSKETIRFVSKLAKTQQEIEEFLDRVVAVSASV
jgi:thiol-disulfide isomerase/thioredoxin